jgi:hypothetical protein
MPGVRAGNGPQVPGGRPAAHDVLRAFGFLLTVRVWVRKLSTGVDNVVHRLWIAGAISLSAYSFGWGNTRGTCEVG